MKGNKKFINDEIKAYKVNLISDEGENLGEMTLKEAKILASEAGLDLMEMGKKFDVTIIKMLDYGKFLYKQKKQEQKNKSKGKTPDLKTIRITFKISEHDLEVRKKQAIKFASGGHPIKIVLMLRGRENQYESLAREKLNKFIEMLKDYYKLEQKIGKGGNSLFASLLPIKN